MLETISADIDGVYNSVDNLNNNMKNLSNSVDNLNNNMKKILDNFHINTSQNIIFVKKITGDILKIDISNIDKIIGLRQRISVQYKIPFEMCTLIMRGYKLDDNKTLKEYQIVPGTTIFLKLL